MFNPMYSGVIEIDEMAAIFPVEERFTNALKQRKRFSKEEFDRSVLDVTLFT